MHRTSDPFRRLLRTRASECSEAILHLFLLHDYDKSGRLDGLELMQLLKGILSQNSPTKPPPESVILVVDEVLEKQDLNRDGLLSAPELVTPPVYASEPLFEEDPSQDTMHLAIPPPQGTPREERQGILENITKTEKKQGEGPGSEPMDAQDISKDQTNDPAPSREEAYENSQEEPVEGDNEELTDETIPKIAGGQEEQEKEEEEKQDMQKTVGMEDEM
ncbi:cell growth regulator with EF hand domain protein 1 isoform X2 [Ascaphus truei]|uniref:cell growth regulator with EF hand domain protein 1 isoform X2 n=1 Tax=Ascaphus truei TaxID=8439 RepID=UPI003F5909C8